MKTKTNKLMAISGVGVMVAGAAMFYWYEFLGGREDMHYDSVVVLVDEVKEGHIITEDDWGYLAIDKELILDSTILNPNEIVGQSAKHYIAPFEKLHPNYFDNPNVTLKTGEYITPIPMDWVLTVPSTLRRGDEIIIYAATKVEESTQQTVVYTTEDTAATSTAAEPESGPLLPVEDSELKELFTTRVAYVKDGSNQEVVTTSSFDRLDGSSAINSLELIMTTDEFKEVEAVIKEGGKLIVMYGKNS